MPAPTGYVQITATKIKKNASGAPLPKGRMIWSAPVNNLSEAISARDTEGPIMQEVSVFLIQNGTIIGKVNDDGSVTSPDGAIIADTSRTDPINAGYRVRVLDEWGADVLGPGYDCVQPVADTDGLWSFDTYRPPQATLVAQQVGLPGPAGTVAVGSVTDGDSAAVTNSGTPQAAVFDFVLRRGLPGAAASVGNMTGTFGAQVYNADGAATTFAKPVTGHALVFVNGILQTEGTHFSQNDAGVTLNFVPDADWKIALLVFPSGTGGNSGNYDPAHVAITGGSINGVAIGASTPSSASFTTLTVGNGQLQFPNNNGNLEYFGNFGGFIDHAVGFSRAGVVQLKIDSLSDAVKTKNNTLDDGSGNANFAGISGITVCKGPATAPSGSCTGFEGCWVFSQDGHATYGDPSTHNWITKI